MTKRLDGECAQVISPNFVGATQSDSGPHPYRLMGFSNRLPPFLSPAPLLFERGGWRKEMFSFKTGNGVLFAAGAWQPKTNTAFLL